jgi:hypothetical protein
MPGSRFQETSRGTGDDQRAALVVRGKEERCRAEEEETGLSGSRGTAPAS